jgi:hypothetical protein
MGRNGFMGAFQGLDAFGKVSLLLRWNPFHAILIAGSRQTMEDVKIRTRTGALRKLDFYQ